MHSRIEAGTLQPQSRSSRNFSSGTFEIGQLRAGTYVLLAGPQQVLWSSNSGSNDNALTITVGPGEELSGIRLRYAGATGQSVSGRVIDEQGQPIARATIVTYSASYQQTTSGADGQFTISGMGQGQQNLQVQHSSYTHKNQTVEAGATNVEIVLQAAATISGVILDQSTGRPVQDFELMVQQGGGPIQPGNYRNFSRRRSDDGSFTVDSVQAGTNMLAVRASGYAKSELRLDNLLPGETRDGVVVYLEVGNMLVGRVFNEQGQTVNGAMIFEGQMPNYNFERAALAKTAGNGNFKLDSVPAGSTTIFAAHPDYATGSQTVNIRPGVENSVDIQLSSGGAVEGYVTENGKPIASQYVSVNIQQPTRENKNSQTDAKGYYSVGGLRGFRRRHRLSETRRKIRLVLQILNVGNRIGSA